MNLPLNDADWQEDHWKYIIEKLISCGIFNYKELASLALGHLNPPQVGTSIASNKSFQKCFPKGQCWKAVQAWLYSQNGICADCKTRLELQVDHVIPKEEIGDEANQLSNLAIRCRRCNVAKRPSHKNSKLTFLTTESALMWILLVKKPKTYEEYTILCRNYGLTMANIRFKEAWAMKEWLDKNDIKLDDIIEG